MYRKLMIAVAAMSFLAAPALAEEKAAENCEAMLKKAQEVIAASSLDEAAGKVVAEMREKARKQLQAGDEEGCRATAGELLKALGG